MEPPSVVTDPVTIGELLRDIDAQDESLTVFAPAGEPVTPATRVVLVDEEAAGPPAGTVYFLEVALVKEVIDVWQRERDYAEPTPEQAFDAVLYYVTRDDHQPAG